MADICISKVETIKNLLILVLLEYVLHKDLPNIDPKVDLNSILLISIEYRKSMKCIYFCSTANSLWEHRYAALYNQIRHLDVHI